MSVGNIQIYSLLIMLRHVTIVS